MTNEDQTAQVPMVLVLTGAPGVGKSSVARALAAGLPLCAHVGADTLQRMVVSGGQWPSAATVTAHEQLLLRTRNAALLAASFARSAIPVVLDEVLAWPEQMRCLSDALADIPWRVVGLTAEPAVVRLRDAGRHKQTAALYEGVESAIRSSAAGATWIDTTDLAQEETVHVARTLVGW